MCDTQATNPTLHKGPHAMVEHSAEHQCSLLPEDRGAWNGNRVPVTYCTVNAYIAILRKQKQQNLLRKQRGLVLAGLGLDLRLLIHLRLLLTCIRAAERKARLL